MLPLSPLPMPSNKRARSEGPGQLSLPLPLPKRRAIVPACSSHTRSSHALTSTNLDRLQRALSQPPLATASDMSDSQISVSTGPANLSNDRQQLKAYLIHLDREQPMPADLEALLQTIRQPRDPDEAVSPNANCVIDRRRIAVNRTERDGIAQIAPWLLFNGVADLPASGIPAEPLITVKDEILLHKNYLPKPPDEEVLSTWGYLKEARVDRCIGYVSREDAENARCQAPFTKDEEKALETFCLAQHIYFPFLTTQWKKFESGNNVGAARIQAARDGASIVNYLHTFFESANDRAPSPALTCHFSLVCDMESSEIWVHWREDKNHYMEHVYSFHLRRDSGVPHGRQILKNILKHAVTSRLQNIKEAIPRFGLAWARKPVTTRRTSNSNSSAKSGTKFAKPMTPKSSASGQAKKRRLS